MYMYLSKATDDTMQAGAMGLPQWPTPLVHKLGRVLDVSAWASPEQVASLPV